MATVSMSASARREQERIGAMQDVLPRKPNGFVTKPTPLPLPCHQRVTKGEIDEDSEGVR